MKCLTKNLADGQTSLGYRSEQEMEKSACFVETKTKTLLAIPDDWEDCREHPFTLTGTALCKLKACLIDLEVSSPIKIVTTVEWGKRNTSGVMCQHMWEHLAETNKIKQIPEDLITSLHLDSFGFYFLILFWGLLCEKPIMSRSVRRVICLDSGLALRFWGSEEQNQDAVWGGGGGM